MNVDATIVHVTKVSRAIGVAHRGVRPQDRRGVVSEGARACESLGRPFLLEVVRPFYTVYNPNPSSLHHSTLNLISTPIANRRHP